jgi:ABC-2 type transport system permease protein
VSRLLSDASTIALKDLRELWRDGRIVWAAVTLALILLVAAGTGYVHTAAALRQHREAEAAERLASLDRGDMNPHAAAHYGAFVFKPIEPLAALDPGIDPFVGVSLFLEAHQQTAARHQPVADLTAARRLGEMSVATVLQQLVPLLIVTLTAGAFAGERERGNLRPLLATGVSRSAITLGKLGSCGLPVMATVVPTVVASLLAVLALSTVDRDAVLRLALVAGLYAAYFGLWLAVGLVVSMRASSSAAALIVLLGIWFGACFVLPRAAIAWVSGSHPTATSAEFDIAVQQAREALPAWPDRVADVERRFLEGTLPPDSDLPSNPEVIALVDTERDESGLYERLFVRQFDGFDRQAEAFGRAGWLVPTIGMQTLSMALAGTDYTEHRRFVDAARTYRTRFLDLLNQELVAYREVNTFDYTSGRELWERIPAFDFTPPDVWTVVESQRQRAAGLVIWLVLAGLTLVWSARRLGTE